MMEETEARSILRTMRIERDINETRTCAEILIALGVISINSEELPVTVEDKI